MGAGIYFAFTFNIKLGTWDQPSANDIKEPITVELICLSHDQMAEILASVINDECIDRLKRSEPMRKEIVCASVARWFGRRPKGVTPYIVARHVVDNIPVWIQEAIAQRARELYNESMRIPKATDYNAP